MSRRSIQWAQALDNASDDVVRINGEDVEINQLARRQEAVSIITTIVAQGKCVARQGEIRVHSLGRKVVIIVPSDQNDSIGRVAPLYLYIDGIPDDEVSEQEISGAILAFAKSIGRTVDAAKLDTARLLVLEFKKKRTAHLCILFILCAVVLTILVWAFVAMT